MCILFLNVNMAFKLNEYKFLIKVIFVLLYNYKWVHGLLNEMSLYKYHNYEHTW